MNIREAIRPAVNSRAQVFRGPQGVKSARAMSSAFGNNLADQYRLQKSLGGKLIAANSGPSCKILLAAQSNDDNGNAAQGASGGSAASGGGRNYGAITRQEVASIVSKLKDVLIDIDGGSQVFYIKEEAWYDAPSLRVSVAFIGIPISGIRVALGTDGDYSLLLPIHSEGIDDALVQRINRKGQQLIDMLRALPMLLVAAKSNRGSPIPPSMIYDALKGYRVPSLCGDINCDASVSDPSKVKATVVYDNKTIIGRLIKWLNRCPVRFQDESVAVLAVRPVSEGIVSQRLVTNLNIVASMASSDSRRRGGVDLLCREFGNCSAAEIEDLMDLWNRYVGRIKVSKDEIADQIIMGIAPVTRVNPNTTGVVPPQSSGRHQAALKRWIKGEIDKIVARGDVVEPGVFFARISSEHPLVTESFHNALMDTGRDEPRLSRREFAERVGLDIDSTCSKDWMLFWEREGERLGWIKKPHGFGVHLEFDLVRKYAIAANWSWRRFFGWLKGLAQEDPDNEYMLKLFTGMIDVGVLEGLWSKPRTRMSDREVVAGSGIKIKEPSYKFWPVEIIRFAREFKEIKAAIRPRAKGYDQRIEIQKKLEVREQLFAAAAESESKDRVSVLVARLGEEGFVLDAAVANNILDGARDGVRVPTLQMRIDGYTQNAFYAAEGRIALLAKQYGLKIKDDESKAGSLRVAKRSAAYVGKRKAEWDKVKKPGAMRLVELLEDDGFMDLLCHLKTQVAMIAQAVRSNPPDEDTAKLELRKMIGGAMSRGSISAWWNLFKGVRDGDSPVLDGDMR